MSIHTVYQFFRHSCLLDAPARFLDMVYFHTKALGASSPSLHLPFLPAGSPEVLQASSSNQGNGLQCFHSCFYCIRSKRLSIVWGKRWKWNSCHPSRWRWEFKFGHHNISRILRGWPVRWRRRGWRCRVTSLAVEMKQIYTKMAPLNIIHFWP